MSVALLPSFETYGRPVRKREFAGFAVSVGAHGPRESIPAHRHADEHVWCLTLSGSFEEDAASRRETSAAGSVLIRPPDCIHSDRFSATPAVCLNLFPRDAWLTANDLASIGDIYLHQRSPHLLALGHALARELEHDDEAAPFAVECLLIELLTRTARLDELARVGFARWFAIALDEIDANLSGELRLSDLARSSGVSAGHLARSFRSEFGQSAGDYVRARRLARAADMLRKKELRLAEIAAAVGFCDQAHFSRAFKARFGMPPAAYRRQVAA